MGYLKPRLPWIGAAAASGLAVALLHAAPLVRNIEDLEQALSDEVEGKASAVTWEPSRGSLLDFLLGRPLLFEARLSVGEPRDIFRTLVRLSPEGRVLSIGQVHNLTRTQESDEQGLVGNDYFAAWSSRSDIAPSALSVLRFNASSLSPDTSWLGRFQIGLSQLIETGTWVSPARMDVISPDPNTSLQLELSPSELTVSVASPKGALTHRLDLDRWLHAATQAKTDLVLDSAPISGALLVPRQTRALPWTHFGANLLRSYWGTEFVGKLERTVFAAQDGVKRTGYDLGTSAHKSSSSKHSTPPLPPDQKRPNWPPADRPTDAEHPEDGKWTPWMSQLLPAESEALFYRTVLHHDEKRPYAELHLVAFDMRRLQLGMRAGYEDPEPDTGPPGSGHIPFESATGVVATFNGAFKSTHGKYGMKAEGRVLNTPQLGAATVRVDPDGRVGMGTWTGAHDLAETVEMRQNLDPLLARGKINPEGRTTWGEHVDATGVAIERSALCLHESGHLLYAWATEATGESLAQGLKNAGCSYAMHLDMNPGHCTFALNRIASVDPLKAEGELLDRRMKANETRYVRWSPKDFFYLTRRSDDADRQIETGLSFQPLDGAQPSPDFIPGVYTAQRNLGPLSVRVYRIDPGRVRFQAVPGVAESLHANAAIPKPQLAPHPQALLAFGLGHQTHGFRAGLSVDDEVVVPLSRGYGTLVFSKGKKLEIRPPGEPLAEAEGTVAVQLPALVRDGRLLQEAKELGGRRTRQALCIDPKGTFYFGFLEHDSIAPLAQTLLELGCKLVLEADRGSKSPPYQASKGAKTPPQVGWAETVLYAVDQEMSPPTYEF